MVLVDKKDLCAATCLGVFGIYVAVEAFELPYISEFGPGPGFFPRWIGIALTTLSLLLVLANLIAPTTDKSGERRAPRAIARAMVGWFALMLAIGLLSWLGFALSLALLTFFLILALERRSTWVALSVALGIAIGFYAIFNLALGLSLPAGPWGF